MKIDENQTPVDWAGTLPLKDTKGTKSDTRKVKTNKHIFCTNIQHTVPTTTSLQGNAAGTQEEHSNQLHFATYRLPITTSVPVKEPRISQVNETIELMKNT